MNRERAKRGELLNLILNLLPPERNRIWMTPLELSSMEPKLRTRSLHPALSRAVETKVAKRRKHKVTGRWEYARVGTVSSRSLSGSSTSSSLR